MTLDIEMPKMNGLEFLEKLMRLRPMPVIMVSTLTQKGADVTVRALETGAVDYVTKPIITQASHDILEELRRTLVPKIKSIRETNVQNFGQLTVTGRTIKTTKPPQKKLAYDIVGIASSTGGIERLRYLFSGLEVSVPPIVVVQHINKVYVQSFVTRLREIVPPYIEVKIAENREILRPNTVYFANNLAHLEVRSPIKNQYQIVLHDAPPLNGFKASADYLLRSMAAIPQAKRLGLVLSGMGYDGAKGMKELRESGAMTIGEAEQSCIVYGMSKAAAQMGALHQELRIEAIRDVLNCKKT